MKEDYLKKAIVAGKEGTIEAWVHSFLSDDIHKNGGLSEGLKKQKRFWMGPMEIELSCIPRITGPETHLEYVVDKKGWDAKTQRMAKDLKEGWLPAPLIVEHRDGILSLRDGNHRREALGVAGFKKYWTIIWFNSEEALKKYK